MADIDRSMPVYPALCSFYVLGLQKAVLVGCHARHLITVIIFNCCMLPGSHHLFVEPPPAWSVYLLGTQAPVPPFNYIEKMGAEVLKETVVAPSIGAAAMYLLGVLRYICWGCRYRYNPRVFQTLVQPWARAAKVAS